MTINWVRGFRRIGWILTLPLAALIVLAFYENTKQFSTTNYEVSSLPNTLTDAEMNSLQAQAAVDPKDRITVELPLNHGRATFAREVPKEISDRIIADYVAKEDRKIADERAKLKSEAQKQPSGDADDWEDVNTESSAFTVHKEVSILRLSGLIGGSFALSVLMIQGSISILAWIFRGFKG
jgi:hypothetical protein